MADLVDQHKVAEMKVEQAESQQKTDDGQAEKIAKLQKAVDEHVAKLEEKFVGHQSPEVHKLALKGKRDLHELMEKFKSGQAVLDLAHEELTKKIGDILQGIGEKLADRDMLLTKENLEKNGGENEMKEGLARVVRENEEFRRQMMEFLEDGRTRGRMNGRTDERENSGLIKVARELAEKTLLITRGIDRKTLAGIRDELSGIKAEWEKAKADEYERVVEAARVRANEYLPRLVADVGFDVGGVPDYRSANDHAFYADNLARPSLFHEFISPDDYTLVSDVVYDLRDELNTVFDLGESDYRWQVVDAGKRFLTLSLALKQKGGVTREDAERMVDLCRVWQRDLVRLQNAQVESDREVARVRSEENARQQREAVEQNLEANQNTVEGSKQIIRQRMFKFPNLLGDQSGKKNYDLELTYVTQLKSIYLRMQKAMGEYGVDKERGDLTAMATEKLTPMMVDLGKLVLTVDTVDDMSEKMTVMEKTLSDLNDALAEFEEPPSTKSPEQEQMLFDLEHASDEQVRAILEAMQPTPEQQMRVRQLEVFDSMMSGLAGAMENDSTWAIWFQNKFSVTEGNHKIVKAFCDSWSERKEAMTQQLLDDSEKTLTDVLPFGDPMFGEIVKDYFGLERATDLGDPEGESDLSALQAKSIGVLRDFNQRDLVVEQVRELLANEIFQRQSVLLPHEREQFVRDRLQVRVTKQLSEQFDETFTTEYWEKKFNEDAGSLGLTKEEKAEAKRQFVEQRDRMVASLAEGMTDKMMDELILETMDKGTAGDKFPILEQYHQMIGLNEAKSSVDMIEKGTGDSVFQGLTEIAGAISTAASGNFDEFKQMVDFSKWNVSDETMGMIQEELAMMPLILVSAGLARAAVSGATTLVRMAAAANRLRKLGLVIRVATTGERIVEGASHLGRALTRFRVPAALALEGGTTTTMIEALQGRSIFADPDAMSKLIWGTIMFGGGKGVGKLTERTLFAEGSKLSKAFSRIGNETLRESAKQMLIKEHLEGPFMLAVSAIQQQMTVGNFEDWDLAREVLRSYVGALAMEAGGGAQGRLMRAIAEATGKKSDSERQPRKKVVADDGGTMKKKKEETKSAEGADAAGGDGGRLPFPEGHVPVEAWGIDALGKELALTETEVQLLRDPLPDDASGHDITARIKQLEALAGRLELQRRREFDRNGSTDAESDKRILEVYTQHVDTGIKKLKERLERSEKTKATYGSPDDKGTWNMELDPRRDPAWESEDTGTTGTSDSTAWETMHPDERSDWSDDFVYGTGFDSQAKWLLSHTPTSSSHPQELALFARSTANAVMNLRSDVGSGKVKADRMTSVSEIEAKLLEQGRQILDRLDSLSTDEVKRIEESEGSLDDVRDLFGGRGRADPLDALTPKQGDRLLTPDAQRQIDEHSKTFDEKMDILIEEASKETGKELSEAMEVARREGDTGDMEVLVELSRDKVELERQRQDGLISPEDFLASMKAKIDEAEGKAPEMEILVEMEKTLEGAEVKAGEVGRSVVETSTSAAGETVVRALKEHPPTDALPYGLMYPIKGVMVKYEIYGMSSNGQYLLRPAGDAVHPTVKVLPRFAVGEATLRAKGEGIKLSAPTFGLTSSGDAFGTVNGPPVPTFGPTNGRDDLGTVNGPSASDLGIQPIKAENLSIEPLKSIAQQERLSKDIAVLHRYRSSPDPTNVFQLTTDIEIAVRQLKSGVREGLGEAGKLLMNLEKRDSELFKLVLESDIERLVRTECFDAIIKGNKIEFTNMQGEQVIVYAQKTIGEGGMGSVALGAFYSPGSENLEFGALKRPHSNKTQYFSEEVAGATLVHGWDCDSIMKPLQVSGKPDDRFIIYETGEGAKDLSGVYNGDNVNLADHFQSLKEVIRGLQEYRDKGYFHGDLKEANVLRLIVGYTANGKPIYKTKIIDNAPVKIDERSVWGNYHCCTPAYSFRNPSDPITITEQLVHKGVAFHEAARLVKGDQIELFNALVENGIDADVAIIMIHGEQFLYFSKLAGEGVPTAEVVRMIGRAVDARAFTIMLKNAFVELDRRKPDSFDGGRAVRLISDSANPLISGKVDFLDYVRKELDSILEGVSLD